MTEYCNMCGNSDRHTYIRFLCENCLDKLEERPPDATGKLIEEFISDLKNTDFHWRWIEDLIEKWEEKK